MLAALGPVVLLSALLRGATGGSLTFAIAAAVVSPILAASYLAAPAWRFVVHVEDDALVVKHGQTERFRVPWTEVKRVLHAASSKTCFVDGGSPDKSLLVPGPGAPASYAIERREELYDAILAHVPADRLQPVESIQAAKKML